MDWLHFAHDKPTAASSDPQSLAPDGSNALRQFVRELWGCKTTTNANDVQSSAPVNLSLLRNDGIVSILADGILWLLACLFAFSQLG
jgi:hypothetical protein